MEYFQLPNNKYKTNNNQNDYQNIIGSANPYNTDDTIEFVFIKFSFPETTILSTKSGIFSNVIERYKKEARDSGNNNYYYNNQIIDPNSTVSSLNINNNKAYIQVLSKLSDSISNSINSEFSLFYSVPMYFDENGNITKIQVNINTSFLNAMNVYEAKTESKGQNDYYASGQLIDPNKSPDENHLSSNSKIIVKKKNSPIESIEELKLWFQKENTQNILILAKSNELIEVAVDKYLDKLKNSSPNNNQIQDNKFSYFFNNNILKLNQTISQSGLKNDSIISVKENKSFANIYFRLNSHETVIVATLDETIGTLISQFKSKRGLNQNDNYRFIFNAKVLNDPYKTLKDYGFTAQGGQIDVFPPGIIGAE